MEITDVKLRRVNRDGKMKAIVSVIFDDEFVIRDIKVIRGEKGLFIAMPSKKCGNGEFRDIAHPINSKTREKLQNVIIEKYNMLGVDSYEDSSEDEVAISIEYIQ